jgi:hypothetical protein
MSFFFVISFLLMWQPVAGRSKQRACALAVHPFPLAAAEIRRALFAERNRTFFAIVRKGGIGCPAAIVADDYLCGMAEGTTHESDFSSSHVFIYPENMQDNV